MSTTPRTDEAIPKGHINPAMTDYVPASFARILESENHDLRLHLKAMLDLHDTMMNKVNHGASCYDANTIRKMNDVPLATRRLLSILGE